jgi:hypothetical protein
VWTYDQLTGNCANRCRGPLISKKLILSEFRGLTTPSGSRGIVDVSFKSREGQQMIVQTLLA